MKTTKHIAKTMLMGILTVSAVSFTACTDDVEEFANNTPQEEQTDPYGTRASALDYNINNYTIPYYSKDRAPITASNWRGSEGIFLYVGSNNCDLSIKDTEGGTGYVMVPLPWAESGAVNNMPTGFCDDLTPENGWEMAMNFCGDRSLMNGNYFALYNKYTGTLRVFYYVNGDYQAGNDHVWQIAMTDNLAKRSVLNYAMPSDRSITNKALLGQNDAKDWLQFASPWVDSKNMGANGSIELHPGWWCFDVDLSLYRPNDPIAVNDMIEFQMKSWNTSKGSFYSNMLAGIDGSMKGSFEANTTGTVKSANSAQGILSKIAPFTALASPLKKTMEAWSKGNYLDLISSGFDLAKTGTNAATGKPVSGDNVDLKTQGTYQGTIQMQMNGTIQTDGLTTSSANVSGIIAPEFEFEKAFSFTPNSTIGQGVWNLKHSPIVRTPSLKNIISYRDNDLKFYCDNALPYFFDPTSIEVELNPNVFPADQIDSIKVDAVCGVRTEAVNSGMYDAFIQAAGYSREVQGLQILNDNHQESNRADLFHFLKLFYDNVENFAYLNDFFHYTDDKCGLNYCQFNGDTYGRGDSQYLLEPNTRNYFHEEALDSKKESIKDIKVPRLEVSVTVVIKMKNMDKPLIYNRIYLPEIKAFDIWDNEMYGTYQIMWRNINSTYSNLDSHKNFLPKQKETPLYQYQSMRIKKMLLTIANDVPSTIKDYNNLVEFANMFKKH